jgi:medium-chain acyl-[acyl-carrier-protein] hydrolase
MSFYSSKFKIRSTEVDINDNMYPSSIVRLLMETGNRQMEDRKPTYYELLQNNMSFILVRFAFELKDQIKRGDSVEVRTWISPHKAATIPRSYLVIRNGEEVLKAHSDWTVVSLSEKKIIGAADVGLSNYDADEALALEHTKLRFRFAKDRTWEEAGNHLVRYDEIDRNMHMNNTYYENMFWSRVPEVSDKELRSFSLAFFHEAALDSRIDIFRSELGENIKEKGLIPDDKDSKTYLFRSTVGGERNCEAVIRTASLIR